MQTLITNTVLNFIPRIQKNLFRLLSFFLLLPVCPFPAVASSPLPVVAITQIIQHASLDQERQGVVAALEEGGYSDGKTVTLIYENAQGNIATAGLIASNFAGRKPVVVVAISTPCAQALVKPMAEQDIPWVFTAVTDPLEAKLVTTFDSRPEAVTGVCDGLIPGPQLDLIQQLVPAVKTIGVIYNPGEPNSAKAVRQLQEEASKRGLSLVLATAEKSSDIMTATRSLMEKVGGIYIPNDNTAVASMESIVMVGKKFKVPVFAGDSGSVERGALAAYAYDRTDLGRKAGALAVKILKGRKAGDLPVETKHPLILMLNLESAQAMGVAIPDAIKAQAQVVGRKS